MCDRTLLVSLIATAILASSTPAVAADWVLWEKTSRVGAITSPPDKITTIGVYPTKPACAAAALKLAQELAATKPESVVFPFTEGPRAGAGAGYVWNAKAYPPYGEVYEATCWPVGVNPK
jgi:hypothetical protein